jgi:Helix-turn-helix domain
MTKADQIRVQAWRFKILRRAAATGNVARTCRHFGLSRKTFYKWKRRFDAHGQAGLGDRSRTPHHSPRSTPPDVVSKILYLRQRYHFGPGKDRRLLAAIPRGEDRRSLGPPPAPEARDESATGQSEAPAPP